jgi:hypothetical protein
MLIHKYLKEITVTSGSGSDNTLKFSGAELVQMIVIATTSTNIYDLSLVDEDNDEIWGEDAIEGSFEEHGLYIPFRGIYTITIANATIDENIRVKLLVEE